MFFNHERSKFRTRRLTILILVWVTAVLLTASCSSSRALEVSSPSDAPVPPSPAAPTAAELLAKARTATQEMKKYKFDLLLTQHLSGEAEGDKSSVDLTMQGLAELGPLKLDQTIKSDIDGEKSTLRAILVPDAYYMYNPDFQEWTKLSKQQTGDIVKTLSDLQVNPGKSLEEIQTLGSVLKLKSTGGTDLITFDGTGPEAKAYLDKLLQSTLYLSDMDPKVRNSMNLETMHVELTLDTAHHWPLSYRIESVMTVEYEAGKPSTLKQTLEGNYSEHNASASVVIPDAAKNAVELEPPMD